MLLSELLSAIVNASEKAAQVARSIRKEDLFSLLIQEKTAEEKSARFEVDFKTLADVLIQEMIRHDLDTKFPGIGKRVFGEESNQFTNTQGETVTIALNGDKTATFELLKKAFDGNRRVAEVLADVVTGDFSGDIDVPNNYANVPLDPEGLGIWIDPIDSTLEYIMGGYDEVSSDPISRSGLRNVTVLIGVFAWSDGLPFMGVINQPFHRRANLAEPWSGRVVWGASHPDVQAAHNAPERGEPERVILASSSDVRNLERCFRDSDAVIRKAPGAGYKQLCVIDGRARAYVLFSTNTYRWDSCGPHGVLRAVGGGVLRLTDALQRADEILNSEGPTRANLLRELQVTYSDEVLLQAKQKAACDRFINAQGLLVYPDERVLIETLNVLRKEAARL